MRSPPPDFLRCPPNEAVLAWLEGKSAHSDPAEALRRASEGLPGFGDFTPDGASFAYYVVHRGPVIFGFVEGMQGATLRLPAARVAELAARGARCAGHVGSDWVFLPLYVPGGFVGELPLLVREAHAFAATLAPS